MIWFLDLTRWVFIIQVVIPFLLDNDNITTASSEFFFGTLCRLINPWFSIPGKYLVESCPWLLKLPVRFAVGITSCNVLKHLIAFPTMVSSRTRRASPTWHPIPNASLQWRQNEDAKRYCWRVPDLADNSKSSSEWFDRSGRSVYRIESLWSWDWNSKFSAILAIRRTNESL